jgi:hypothetical protein
VVLQNHRSRETRGCIGQDYNSPLLGAVYQ